MALIQFSWAPKTAVGKTLVSLAGVMGAVVSIGSPVPAGGV